MREKIVDIITDPDSTPNEQADHILALARGEIEAKVEVPSGEDNPQSRIGFEDCLAKTLALFQWQ